MTPKNIGRLFVFQVAANIIVLCFIIAQLVLAAADLQHIQAQQIHYVQDQNTLSLCAQREVIVSVRNIGRKLGLPVDDIVLPRVDRDLCRTLVTEFSTLTPTEAP